MHPRTRKRQYWRISDATRAFARIFEKFMMLLSEAVPWVAVSSQLWSSSRRRSAVRKTTGGQRRGTGVLWDPALPSFSLWDIIFGPPCLAAHRHNLVPLPSSLSYYPTLRLNLGPAIDSTTPIQKISHCSLQLSGHWDRAETDDKLRYLPTCALTLRHENIL